MNNKASKKDSLKKDDKWEKRRERQMRPYTKERFLFAAQCYLERFPCSVARFESVMERKFMKKRQTVERDWIDEARDWAIKNGFLNDDLYGQAVFDSLDRKGLPPIQIQQKLTVKQLDRGHISDLVSTIDNDLDAQKQRIMIYAQRKRLGPFLTRHLDEDKHYARLRRAGFSHEAVAWIMADERTHEQDD